MYKESTYFAWPDRSLLVCLQIRYEQTACVHSVKQENSVGGTYLQRNDFESHKLRMLLSDISRESSYCVNLCCESDNFQRISLYLSFV